MVLGKGTDEDLDPSLYFRLSGGREIKSLKELRDALVDIDSTLFYRHANPFKNDFSSWIKDVFHLEELAERVRKANREQMIKILTKAIEHENPESKKSTDHKEPKLKDDDDARMQKMNNELEEIEDKVKGMGENESIDDALKRLQALYKRRNEENAPQQIVVHDAISESESLINLGADPIEADDDSERSIGPVQVEETSTRPVRHNAARLEDNRKTEQTREHIPHATRHEEKENHELTNLKLENRELKAYIASIKEKADELERNQSEFENSLKRTHEHVHRLRGELEKRERMIASLEQEKTAEKKKPLVHDNEKKRYESSIAKLKDEKSSLLDEMSMLRAEISEYKKREKEFDHSRLLVDVAPKEYDKRERELSKREAELEQISVNLRKRTAELEKAEKETMSLRSKYMKDIRELMEEKKRYIERQKNIERQVAMLKEKDRMIVEKERDIYNKERSLRKRADRYDKELADLKKSLKEMIR